MEKIVEQTLLYDFYGELLTEHQQNVYQDVVFEDMSLSEAAEIHGISRQGIHDLIKRCDRTMGNYEGKLHMIRRFTDIKQLIERLYQLTLVYAKTGQKDLLVTIEELYQDVLKEI